MYCLRSNQEVFSPTGLAEENVRRFSMLLDNRLTPFYLWWWQGSLTLYIASCMERWDS